MTFGLSAVLLVRVFAPYASGSGIPEVKLTNECLNPKSFIIFYCGLFLN